MSTLVISEHDHFSIKNATLSAITAATLIGGPVHLLVAGHEARAAAVAGSLIAGVDRVLHADGVALANSLAENVAAQVLAVAGSFTHILFPATSSGKSAAPRVAACLDVAQISDVIRVVSMDTFERPIYAGNAIATVQSADPVKVLTIRSTGFDPADSCPVAAPIEMVPAVEGDPRIRFMSRESTKSDRPELAAASIVISGGRGLGSEENFNKVLVPLADRLGAALGASRAAVDAGYASNDLQVGQTGKIVAPQLYMACGISGAIQHLAGMKDSKTIVAINKDPEAPIFGVADYGLVADLFEAIPELTRAI